MSSEVCALIGREGNVIVSGLEQPEKPINFYVGH